MQANVRTAGIDGHDKTRKVIVRSAEEYQGICLITHDTLDWMGDDDWTVTEYTTGMAMSTGALEGVALAKAETRIDRKTVDAVNARIAEFIAMDGPANDVADWPALLAEAGN